MKFGVVLEFWRWPSVLLSVAVVESGAEMRFLQCLSHPWLHFGFCGSAKVWFSSGCSESLHDNSPIRNPTGSLVSLPWVLSRSRAFFTPFGFEFRIKDNIVVAVFLKTSNFLLSTWERNGSLTWWVFSSVPFPAELVPGNHFKGILRQGSFRKFHINFSSSPLYGLLKKILLALAGLDLIVELRKH